jgi:hypothetical protein
VGIRLFIVSATTNTISLFARTERRNFSGKRALFRKEMFDFEGHDKDGYDPG